MSSQYISDEIDFNALPEAPYNGTAGWSGSDASRERAYEEVSNGKLSERQQRVLKSLKFQDCFGSTWRELSEALNLHHGQITGTLSVLHKAGRVARLKEQRGRCSIYVLPEYVSGRDTVSQGRESKIHTCSQCGHSEEA